MDIIKLLPDSLANQIAAGEVVQRPASVVKELLENSVDAGSHSIKLVINDAGKALIQVVDDGKGMSVTDARMCFERHATSKIKKSEDLFKIMTMGFRGEAMASIAAVAQVEMKTKTQEESLGTHIRIEASEVTEQSPISMSDGTNISVKNLFYNVPARRNFLKSNPVEYKHILEEFQRVALANPAISFSLYNNQEEVYAFESSKLSQRIVKLFGQNYREQLIAVAEETPFLNIKGYIGKPEHAKKTRGEQFLFLNNRFIKSGYLNHAIFSAFESLIQDKFPFYVLFLEMDPKHVDINVHPTKTEVKFDDEKTIYGIISSAVRRSLSAFNVMPSLDFQSDVNFNALTPQINTKDLTFSQPTAGSTKKERDYASFKGGALTDTKGNLAHWEDIYASAISESNSAKPEEPPQTTITYASKASDQNTGIVNTQEGSGNLQVHENYIFKQIKSGLLVVNKKNAKERIFYEQCMERLNNGVMSSQQILFPVTIELNPVDFSLIGEIADEIKLLGFDFETFGKSSIVLRGVPTDLSGMDEKSAFEEFIEQLKSNQQDIKHQLHENLAKSMAKQIAKTNGRKLQNEEVQALIDQLFDCNNAQYGPEGNLTYKIIKTEEISSWFDR